MSIAICKFKGYGITHYRLMDSVFIFCPSSSTYDFQKFKQIILHEIVHLYIYNAGILQEVEALINSSDKVYVNKIKSDLNEVVARVFITPKIQGLLYEEESNMNGSKIEYRDRLNAIAHEIILYIKKNGLTKIDSDLIKFAVQRISSIC